MTKTINTISLQKKANILDKIYLIYAFIFIVVLLVVACYFWSPTYDALVGLNNTHVTNAVNNIAPTALNSWLDWMVVFGYFALNILVCIGLPLLVEHNPIYYLALFIFSFIYTFIIAIVANSITEWLIDMGSTFSHTAFIFNYLVEFEVMFILLLAIIMFYKRSQQSDGGYYA